MSEYARKRIAIDDSPSASEHQDADHSSPWHAIKASSVLAFVDRVASFMGAPKDQSLHRKLTAMALSNGAAWFEWRGAKYTGPHVMMIYAQPGRPGGSSDDHAPFQTRTEWDGFCTAMQALRDPNQPMLCKHDLLKIGETIEARQMPAAVAKGWA